MIPPLSNSDKDRSTGNKMSESAAGHKGFFTRLSHRITAFRDFTINAFFILFCSCYIHIFVLNLRYSDII